MNQPKPVPLSSFEPSVYIDVSGIKSVGLLGSLFTLNTFLYGLRWPIDKRSRISRFDERCDPGSSVGGQSVSYFSLRAV